MNALPRAISLSIKGDEWRCMLCRKELIGEERYVHYCYPPPPIKPKLTIVDDSEWDIRVAILRLIEFRIALLRCMETM